MKTVTEIEKQLNHNPPHLMHIDLNSCFATAEQQANPLLRGKPVVVVPFISPRAVVIAPSIEAKRYGIKTCFTLRDARLLCKNVIVRVADPMKYRDVHLRFRKIFRDYTDVVVPKSIDEAVLDFSRTRALYGTRELADIGKEIKQRIKEEIGEAITCNIGISTNQFLAKLAASLHKPDGLDIIDHTNLLDIYRQVNLIDLNGIGDKFEARLNVYGIHTPIDFFNASEELLKKFVFKSVLGTYWYKKLRGFESDPFEYDRASFGRQYALQHPTADPKLLSGLLLKLCEGAGRRMRRMGFAAYGAHVACSYDDYTYWHMGRTGHHELYSIFDLYKRAQWVFNQQPKRKVVTRLGVSFFDISPTTKKPQLSLFEDNEEPDKQRKIADTMDHINDRWGEYTVMLGNMMGLENEAVDRIAFGGVSFLEDLYA